MFNKHLIIGWLLLAMLFLLVACGEEEVRDPYALVTLRQATRGKVVSKGFRYKFHKPQIVALNNHLGVIKEGNLLEFISGRSLESKMEGLKEKDYYLAVVKEFSPFVHFKVEQIYTETDTIFLSQAGAIDYPYITTEDKFNRTDFEDYNLGKIPYNRTSAIKKLLNKKMFVSSSIALVEEDGKKVFMLQAGDSQFRIIDPDDGTVTILKMLVGGNYPFEGGITLTEVEPWPSRRNNHVVSNVEVNFVKYGRMVISG